jgi:hypothetical protein
MDISLSPTPSTSCRGGGAEPSQEIPDRQSWRVSSICGPEPTSENVNVASSIQSIFGEYNWRGLGLNASAKKNKRKEKERKKLMIPLRFPFPSM